MFEISHAARNHPEEWRFPRFAGLATGLQPASLPVIVAVKINIWESEYIQGLRKNGSREPCGSRHGIASVKAESLPLVQCLCSLLNHKSLHMDVKERTLS